jgi:murein DD-endopeptidase MepM/ murein hydrolase activator NlpD
MRWGNPRYLWSRAGAGLLIALFATLSASQILVVGSNDGSQEAAARQLLATAGRIEPEYVDEPTAVAPAPEPITISLTIDRSAPVLSYLEEAGLDRDEAQRWAQSFEQSAASDVLQSGHSLTLYKDPENDSLRELKYNLDDRVAVRARTYGNGVIRSSQELITYVVRPVAVAFMLDRNFWEDAARNDLPQPIVATLANAFKDQHPLTALPRGSAVKLIYQERMSRDGMSHLPTGLEAARISFGNQTLSAFAFRDANGQAHLYNADGEALEPQSLRFPVEFQYISSGFSFRRYHPILHQYRAHTGVDLAAHYGAPVKAISDGRIESAGWCGELGRCVKIDHEAGLISIYGHLSEITPSLQAGNAVHIGEVIGRVGSSGLSTGSHLHFALEKNGQFVNPLTESLGTHNQVPLAMRALFNRLKQKYVAVLDRMPQIGGHFSVPFSTVARAKSGADVSAAAARTNPGQAGTVRTIATERSGLLSR